MDLEKRVQELEQKDKAMEIAYGEQAQIVQEYAGKLENYKNYAKIRNSKGKQQGGRSEHFSKAKHTNCRKLLKKRVLSLAEHGLLAVLGYHLQLGTNIVLNAKLGMANQADIIEMTGASKNTIREALKNLCEHGVVERIEVIGDEIKQEEKGKHFRVNPQYYACAC